MQAPGRHLRRHARRQPLCTPSRRVAQAVMDFATPVILLPLALASRAEQIGEGFAADLAPGSGERCARCVLVLGLEGPALERFCASASRALAGRMAGQAGASLARCDGAAFLRRPGGPLPPPGLAALVVACFDMAQLQQVAMSLQGQVTTARHLLACAPPPAVHPH